MACEDALSPEECDELGIGVGSEEPACVADMESNRQQMIALALECGASCDLIGSIDAPRTGEGRSYSRYDYAEFSSECHQPLSVASQYEGFDDCARVYACAALAYTYAIDNIESYDGDCTAAAEAGLREVRCRSRSAGFVAGLRPRLRAWPPAPRSPASPARRARGPIRTGTGREYGPIRRGSARRAASAGACACRSLRPASRI
jgi:hypothetical protein